MIDIQKNRDNNIIEIKSTGTFTGADFEHLEPVLDKHIKESSRPRLLLVMEEFSGWDDISTFWEDLKIDTKYIGKFDRIALIGDAGWEE